MIKFVRLLELGVDLDRTEHEAEISFIYPYHGKVVVTIDGTLTAKEMSVIAQVMEEHETEVRKASKAA